MGSIYARGNKLWMAYVDASGKRKWAPTGFSVGEEKQAKGFMASVEAKIAAERKLLGHAETPRRITFTLYQEGWIKGRKARGITTASDDDTRLRLHVQPVLGRMLMADIRPRHIRDLVRSLASKAGPGDSQLAPKTVRNIYGTLHTMFKDAVADEVPGVTSNPCVLKSGELPEKMDKDPLWRSTALFTRAEVEQVISDERIPEDRRTFYAFTFLAGMRFGETAARRWRDYDAVRTPLGHLLVSSSYNTKLQIEKSTKTKRVREVPVHPTLAKILAQWRLRGWQEAFGRQPTPEDLIVPSRELGFRSANHMLKKFHEDLERIGLRPRRQHDLRRTFISLGRGDGARKDMLQWVTHGPRGDVIDDYTTPPWAALCEAVACLKIDLLEGQVIALPRAVGDGEQPASMRNNKHIPDGQRSLAVLLKAPETEEEVEAFEREISQDETPLPDWLNDADAVWERGQELARRRGVVTPAVTSSRAGSQESENPASSQGLGGAVAMRGGRDSNTDAATVSTISQGREAGITGESGGTTETECTEAQPDCHTVTPTRATKLEALAEAAREWARNGRHADRAMARAAEEGLLQAIEELDREDG